MALESLWGATEKHRFICLANIISYQKIYVLNKKKTKCLRTSEEVATGLGSCKIAFLNILILFLPSPGPDVPIEEKDETISQPEKQKGWNRKM